MFIGFCSRCEDVKISCVYYYKKVHKINISFVKLGEEECERCELCDKHLEDINKLEKHELSKPDENGKNKKSTFVNCGRERYHEEKNGECTDNEKVVHIDM